MSHIVTIQVEVRGLETTRSACRRLELKEATHGKASVFGTEIEGVLVELPNWVYPVVCNPDTGEVRYDNFGGKWGDVKHLHHLYLLIFNTTLYGGNMTKQEFYENLATRPVRNLKRLSESVLNCMSRRATRIVRSESDCGICGNGVKSGVTGILPISP